MYSAPVLLARETCSLQPIAEEAWQEASATPAEPTTRLQFVDGDIDLTCTVDAFRVRQVFRNLFENAIHASPACGLITVRWAHTLLNEAPALQATVSDQGPGFTAEQRAQAFQPFFTTKASGTGLGLPICQRIIESHGGLIAIDGDGNGGASIVITLPRRREP